MKWVNWRKLIIQYLIKKTLVQKFYKDYKSTIQSMSRNELSGLNRSILAYAMNDINEDKLISFWKEKFETVAKNESFTENQKLFLLNFSKK